MRPWRPPFHASPATRKGPISSKRASSQDPLLRKFGNLSLYSLNFHQILAHKPPNLEIFSSQAPKFGNFPLTSPRFQRQIMSVHKPHTSEIRAAHPYLKKSWVPPPPGMFLIDLYGIQWLWRSACPPVCLAGFKGHQWIWPIDPPWNRPIGLSCNLVWDWQTGLLLELVSVWKPWIGFT